MIPDTETPLFTSWGQVTVFVVALGAVIRWLWPFLRKNGNGKLPSRAEIATERREQSAFRQELRGAMTMQTEILRQLTEMQQRSGEAFARYTEMQRQMLEYLEKSLALVREMEARVRFGPK